MPVQGICGRRMNLYQYFTVVGTRFLHLFELKNIRCPVVCVHNCFHEFPPSCFDSVNAVYLTSDAPAWPGFTRMTETSGIPTSRTFLSKPCTAALSNARCQPTMALTLPPSLARSDRVPRLC